MSDAINDLGLGAPTVPVQSLPVAPDAIVAAASTVRSPSFSEAQLASARASWIKAGHDAAAFDAALAGTTPERVDNVIPEKPREYNPTIVTKAQAAALVDELRANGVPAEKIAEALAADGLSLSDLPDAKTAELDREFGVNQAADFDIRYEAPDVPIEQIAAFNNEATGWLSALGIDASLGKALVERAMTVGKQYAAMSPAERDLFKQSQRIEATRQAGGADKLNEAMARATLAIKKAGPSQFTQALLEHGVMHDAWTILTLANHGARLEARARAK